MTAVTREHRAGLELALSELDIDGAAALKLLGLIAQASDAPEQEPVGTLLINEYFDGREVGEVDVQLDNNACERLAAEYPGRSLPLYTHPSAEIERLRERDAQILAMHRELHALVPDGYTDPDAPLSATAQPAEGRKPFDRDGYVLAMREVAKEFARADGTAGKVSKWALGRINATAEVKS